MWLLVPSYVYKEPLHKASRDDVKGSADHFKFTKVNRIDIYILIYQKLKMVILWQLVNIKQQ